MSTELYQKAGQQYKETHKEEGREASEEEPKGKDDNVVDADYEVKDEEKKGKKK